MSVAMTAGAHRAFVEPLEQVVRDELNLLVA
jgi:hypothetical protein